MYQWEPVEKWNNVVNRREVVALECSMCRFRRGPFDSEEHLCPTMYDGRKVEIHLNDTVYAYVNDMIIKAIVEKYKKSTDNITVRWIDPPETAHQIRFVVGRPGRIAKV